LRHACVRLLVRFKRFRLLVLAAPRYQAKAGYGPVNAAAAPGYGFRQCNINIDHEFGRIVS
jgi:hypothetical protein